MPCHAMLKVSKTGYFLNTASVCVSALGSHWETILDPKEEKRWTIRVWTKSRANYNASGWNCPVRLCSPSCR